MTSPLTSEFNKYLNRDMGEMYEMMGYIDRPINDFYSMDNFCIKAFGEPVSLEYIEAKEPTCTESGNVAYWLDRRSGAAYADEEGKELLEDTVIPAKGHDWGKWELTKEPTDTEDGEETRICKVCGETETRSVPHSEDESSTPGDSSVPEDTSSGDDSKDSKPSNTDSDPTANPATGAAAGMGAFALAAAAVIAARKKK